MMDELDIILDSLGLRTPDERQALRGRLMLFAVERACIRLEAAGRLEPAEIEHIRVLLSTPETLTQADFDGIFNTPERQDVFKTALLDYLAEVEDEVPQ